MTHPWKASCSAKPPPLPAWRAPEGPQGLAAAPERSEGRAAGHAGRGARGRRGLVGQRADAPIEASSPDGRSGRADTTASRISHVIPPQHESTQAQKPQNINDQNPNSDMRSRELHAKLLVDSHSWASGRCAEPHVSTLSSPAAHPASPAPKQPAGPQATASATQQHVVLIPRLFWEHD